MDSAPPSRKAKPSGESDLRFVAVDANAPYVMNFDCADGSKTGEVWTHWVSPTGETGPWSEPSRPAPPQRPTRAGPPQILEP